MIGKKKVKLEFSINWLIGIFLVAAVLIGMYVLGPQNWRPSLVFSAAVLAGAATLTNAANGVEARASQARSARVVAALAYIDRWNAPQFYHCKKNGRAVLDTFKKTPRVEDQIAYLDGNAEYHANLVDLLNQFESLSIAITKEVVDEETARQFFRSIVGTYWHTTEGYIRKRRADRDNARLFREFEALHERWKN